MADNSKGLVLVQIADAIASRIEKDKDSPFQLLMKKENDKYRFSERIEHQA